MKGDIYELGYQLQEAFIRFLKKVPFYIVCAVLLTTFTYFAYQAFAHPAPFLTR